MGTAWQSRESQSKKKYKQTYKVPTVKITDYSDDSESIEDIDGGD